MILIPYKKYKVTTPLTKKEVQETLQRYISKPDWRISLRPSMDKSYLEGLVNSGSFQLSVGKYSSTYGRTTFAPVMIGKFEDDPKADATIINITIRPNTAGFIILSIFYILCGFIIFLSVKKGLSEGIVVGIIFYIATYSINMFHFNYLQNKFLHLLNDILSSTCLKQSN